MFAVPNHVRQGALLDRRHTLALGLAASVASVVLATLVIYPLDTIADVRTHGAGATS
jgi:hypothetical protein